MKIEDVEIRLFDLKTCRGRSVGFGQTAFQYLDKPLKNYEDYADLVGDEHWKLITTRMCLSHTTGFQNWRFLKAQTWSFDENGKLATHFKPGTKYGYSGEGLKLLQLVYDQQRQRRKHLQRTLEKNHRRYFYALAIGKIYTI